MKYLDEYRSADAARKLAEQIAHSTRRSWTIMEVCGGQTHAIVRFGIDELLPSNITLVHGPGCPVCVTPVELIDKAADIASRPNVIFTSFGDMLRVPGTAQDLLSVKARGGEGRKLMPPRMRQFGPAMAEQNQWAGAFVGHEHLDAVDRDHS